jgi:hypothetical protein
MDEPSHELLLEVPLNLVGVFYPGDDEIAVGSLVVRVVRDHDRHPDDGPEDYSHIVVTGIRKGGVDIPGELRIGLDERQSGRLGRILLGMPTSCPSAVAEREAALESDGDPGMN